MVQIKFGSPTEPTVNYNAYMLESKRGFKVDFENSSKIKIFHSQAAQDLFVLTALNGKKNGKFVDIGASDPKLINNTYLLESKFGWNGVLIEIDEALANKCKKERSSKVICNDATKIDYSLIFSELGEIDYVSLDIDGLETLQVLEKLPLADYKVKVITFEHDLWRIGNQIKDKSRKIFDDLGYERICSDVANNYNIYEDWYVHPELVDSDKLKRLRSDKQEWKDIIFE